MRKIKGEQADFRQLLSLDDGTCTLCGGKGRYKETYKHKQAAIKLCYKCRGTGRLRLYAKYKGPEYTEAFWPGSSYLVIDESESHFVLKGRNKEIVQIEKTLFDEYWN